MQIKFKVLSASSEDPVHCAANLESDDTFRTWKTKPCKKGTVDLKFESPAAIKSVEVGNNGSAFIELFVGSGDSDEFQVLLPTTSLMSFAEVKSGSNKTKTRLFGLDRLTKHVAPQKWDKMRVVVSQPYPPETEIGLSFLRIETAQMEDQRPFAGSFPHTCIIPQLDEEEGEDYPSSPARLSPARSRDPRSPTPPKSGLSTPIKTATPSRPGAYNPVSTFEAYQKTHHRDSPASKPPLIKSPSPEKSGLLPRALSRPAVKAETSGDSDDDMLSLLSSKTTKSTSEKPKPPSPPTAVSSETAAATTRRLPASFSNTGKDKSKPKATEPPKPTAAEKPKVPEKTEPAPKITSPTKHENSSFGRGASKKAAADAAPTAPAPPTATATVEKKSVTPPPPPAVGSGSTAPPSAPTAKTVVAASTKPKGKPEEAKPDAAATADSKFMKGVVAVISGIQNPERGEIRDIILKHGGQYRPDWGRGCTHLIVAFKNTPKYNQVKDEGGRLVKKGWIFECEKAKKKVPDTKFLWEDDEKPAPKDDSETDEEDVESDEAETDSDRDSPVLGKRTRLTRKAKEQDSQDMLLPGRSLKHGYVSDDGFLVDSSQDEGSSGSDGAPKKKRKAEKKGFSGSGFGDIASSASDSAPRKPSGGDTGSGSVEVKDKPSDDSGVIPSWVREDVAKLSRALTKNKPGTTLFDWVTEIFEFAQNVYAANHNLDDFLDQWEYDVEIPRGIRNVSKTLLTDPDPAKSLEEAKRLYANAVIDAESETSSSSPPPPLPSRPTAAPAATTSGAPPPPKPTTSLKSIEKQAKIEPLTTQTSTQKTEPEKPKFNFTKTIKKEESDEDLLGSPDWFDKKPVSRVPASGVPHLTIKPEKREDEYDSDKTDPMEDISPSVPPTTSGTGGKSSAPTASAPPTAVLKLHERGQPDSGSETDEMSDGEVQQNLQTLKEKAVGGKPTTAAVVAKPSAPSPVPPPTVESSNDFFDGCNIYLDPSLLKDEMRANRTKILLHGGEVADHIDSTTTHIVASSTETAEQYRRKGTSAKLVDSGWVIQCDRKNKRVSEEPFEI